LRFAAANNEGKLRFEAREPFRILVVDDNARFREMMSRCLKRLGHEVVTAVDGFRAWMCFRETPFPIVVADLRMPGLNGIELLKKIRLECPETEVILVSGLAEISIVIEGLRWGVANFIVKPFTESEFVRQLEPSFYRLTLALERAKVKEELYSLQKREERECRMLALGRLISGLVREINTPLAFVSTKAQLLRGFCDEIYRQVSEGASPDKRALEEMQGLLKNLCRGVDRIEALIESVRIFGRAPRGYCPETVLVELMRSAFQESLARKPREVNAEFLPPPESFLVEVHKTEMIGCFVNLLVNAFEAAGYGGSTVRFFTREIPYGTPAFFGLVEVVIEDDGPGIPQAVLDEMFIPFFTTKEQGTGLGLSIAYEAAKRNGAQMEVESREGRGTVMTVRLPLRFADNANVVGERNRKMNSPEKNLRGAADTRCSGKADAQDVG